MLKRVKNQKGFTLIELIAVIAILGVLALLIVPRVGNYTQQATVSRAKADLTTLKNAIERYDAEHTTSMTGTWDLDDTNTITALTGKTNQDGTTTGTPSLGPYIEKIPANLATSNTIAKIRAADPNAITTVPNTGYVIP